jgi:hypothetical protein
MESFRLPSKKTSPAKRTPGLYPRPGTSGPRRGRCGGGSSGRRARRGSGVEARNAATGFRARDSGYAGDTGYARNSRITRDSSPRNDSLPHECIRGGRRRLDIKGLRSRRLEAVLFETVNVAVWGGACCDAKSGRGGDERNGAGQHARGLGRPPGRVNGGVGELRVRRPEDEMR